MSSPLRCPFWPKKKNSSVVFIIVRAGYLKSPKGVLVECCEYFKTDKNFMISKYFFVVALRSATAGKQSRERENVPCERVRKISLVVLLLLSHFVFFPSPIYESTTRASEFSHFHTAERSVSCLAENLMFESASSMRIFERL